MTKPRMKSTKEEVKKKEKGDLDVIFERIRKKKMEQEELKSKNKIEDKSEDKIKSEKDENSSHRDDEKVSRTEKVSRQEVSSESLKVESKVKKEDTMKSSLKRSLICQDKPSEIRQVESSEVCQEEPSDGRRSRQEESSRVKFIKNAYEDKAKCAIDAKILFLNNFKKANRTTVPPFVENIEARGKWRKFSLNSQKSGKMLGESRKIIENVSPGKRKWSIFDEKEPNSQPLRRKIPKLEDKLQDQARFGMDPGAGGPAAESPNLGIFDEMGSHF